MDLGGWLRSLGLGQYETAFRENAINEKVLPSLTAEDLKDLGVSMVGHRRMLLDAIAALRTDPTAISRHLQSDLLHTLSDLHGGRRQRICDDEIDPRFLHLGELRRHVRVVLIENFWSGDEVEVRLLQQAEGSATAALPPAGGVRA